MARMQDFTVEAKIEVVVHKTVKATNPTVAKRVAVQSDEGWWYPDDSPAPTFMQVTAVKAGS